VPTFNERAVREAVLNAVSHRDYRSGWSVFIRQFPRRIEIVSRLIEIRRVRGTWLHEVYRVATNTLILRDYSTGAFLDWEGDVRAGPAEMLEALTHGEPIEAT